MVDATGQPVALASVYVVAAPEPQPDIAQLSDPGGLFALAVHARGIYVLGAREEQAGSGQASVSVDAELEIKVEIRVTSQG